MAKAEAAVGFEFAIAARSNRIESKGTQMGACQDFS
jgi:hypothetical protein